VARLVIEIEEPLPFTIAVGGDVGPVIFRGVAVAEARVTTKKEMFTIATAVPQEPLPSGVPHSMENNQEAESLSESSMQSALLRPMHLGLRQL
jgi:hypothetical protein